MSAAGPPQGDRPLGGAARSAVRGEPTSAAGPPQGDRPLGGAARSAVRGEPTSAAGPPQGDRPLGGAARSAVLGEHASEAGAAARAGVHPVDQILPFGPMLAIGLQHVLVMYAGAIAVPLIVGGALKLPKDQVAFLINADLFACGVATLIQCLGVWKFGIRLPVIMGVTFAAVGPIVAMATASTPITTIFGSVIAAGVFGIAVAPWFGRLVRFFPPIVTGTIIAIIGIYAAARRHQLGGAAAWATRTSARPSIW